MRVLSVIKNEDTENNIVWKCPEEDFNNNSQLIVGESEQALFYRDGVILQTYTGGKYNLSTGNAYGMNTLRKMFTGGISPFHCRVYFINMVHQMENAWGTETPMQLRDAKFGFAVGVRAYGSYTVQVEDAKKFLIKMVGNNVTTFSNDTFDTRDHWWQSFQQFTEPDQPCNIDLDRVADRAFGVPIFWL